MSASSSSPVSVPSAAEFLSFDLVGGLPALPEHLTEIPAWQGHIPFARWLIGAVRPASLVELGVHKGDSYCNFCEAVAERGLTTRCYGVDAWLGDAHAGYYGDEIYRTLSAYHDPRYGSFSRLIRAYFEEACRQFEEGSIDLLHIDGLHTYEAVRADFETWLPKMSPRGVMLFHDTAILQGDFGVWRLWEELVERYPHFTFRHSSGLGVLAVGAEPPPAIRWLTGLEAAAAARVRGFFENLGTRIQEARAVARLTEEGRGLALRLENQRAELHRLHTQLNDTAARQYEFSDHLRREIAQLKRELEKRDEHRLAVEQVLQAVYASHSWRVTAPLRQAVGLLKGWKPLLKRALSALPGGEAALNQAAALRAQYRSRTAATAIPDLAAVKEAFRRASTERFEAFLAGGERLTLPCSAKPKVSVVLVLWNQAPLTLACLQGLAGEFDLPLEVVIVDNASSDQTGALLERLNGARILRNQENVGFLKAVNQGVAEASGEHVLLLNNDAVMRPSSLVAACETLECNRNIGAVGGRIVLLNGRLQEAGSIIWRDGSCLGYARDAEPECGEVMFRRDVDYCSGAFLLFRLATFEQLGGFDEAFAPAYYEETDFCLRLWEHGLRVVYDPRVVIDHFEFGSSEKSEHALALQARNRTTFLAKHEQTLQQQSVPAAEAILAARMRDQVRGRVLIIDDRVPLRNLGSGHPRARHILHEVVDSGRFVTFYPLQTPVETWHNTNASLPLEVEVAMGLGVAGLKDYLANRRGYYDTLWVSRPHNMKVIVRLHEKRPDLFEGMRIVYDAEAVFAVREAHKARLFNDRAALAKAEADITDELALTRIAQRIVTVSETEAGYFRQASQAVVQVIGHGMVAKPTPRGFAARRDLLFVGALDDEGSPNVDSLLWFVGEVMPKLQARLGQAVRLVVVGRNRAPSVQALRHNGVDLLGRVDQLDDQYDQARVFIAPTRFAAGIPHKVHEAAAYGLPVVATGLLATQLGWQDGAELLVADDPDTFAAQVAKLYEDQTLWESVRAKALGRLAQDCDPQLFRERVRAVLEE